MNRIAFKIAASSAIVSMAMVGASSPSEAMRGFEMGRRANGPADRQAAQLHDQAARALAQGQLAQAVSLMEQAVSLSPRDIGYRLLLADAYLKSGRFESARATYGDVVTLDPSNVRGGLSIALIQIAQGRSQAAIPLLDDLAGRAPDADVGLAYALAGSPDRAIALLERAARAPTATPRIRQNLALSYAIAGDWRRARAVAAQDLSPADVEARMTQWAGFARPGAGATQVASLMGVTPVSDPGQPVRLALAPVAADTALAEAAPAPAPAREAAPAVAVAEAVPPAAPVQIAAGDVPAPASAPVWVPSAASYQPAQEAAPEVRAATAEDGAAPPAPVLPPRAAPAPAVQARFAGASRSFISAPSAPYRRAAFTPMAQPDFQRPAPVRSGAASVVVQLGAFSNEANAERAWVQASRHYGLDGRRPLTTTIAVNGRTLHRVSVAGFASQADAQRLCGQIRGQGGACFVRGQAGDASIRWAARYANPRSRNA